MVRRKVRTQFLFFKKQINKQTNKTKLKQKQRNKQIKKNKIKKNKQTWYSKAKDKSPILTFESITW